MRELIKASPNASSVSGTAAKRRRNSAMLGGSYCRGRKHRRGDERGIGHRTPVGKGDVTDQGTHPDANGEEVKDRLEES